MTFYGYTGGDTQFKGALEACGKCWVGQGGATTYTANLKFRQDTDTPALSDWSWGHQVRIMH